MQIGMGFALGAARNGGAAAPPPTIADLYGTGMGQMPLDLDPAAAVLDGNGNVTSLPNKGGAGAAFSATPFNFTYFTRPSNLIVVNPGSYLTTPSPMDLVGVRSFFLVNPDPSLTEFSLAGRSLQTDARWKGATNSFVFSRHDGSTFQTVTVPHGSPLPAGLHLYEVEISGGTVRVFVDGAASGSAAFPWPDFTVNRILSGTTIGTFPTFRGSIGHIQSVITDGSAALDPVMQRVRQALAAQYGIALA